MGLFKFGCWSVFRKNEKISEPLEQPLQFLPKIFEPLNIELILIIFQVGTESTSGHNAPPLHYCNQCGFSFTAKRSLDRHMKKHTTPKSFQCSTCSKRFHRADAKRRHEKTQHSNQPVRRLPNGGLGTCGNGVTAANTTTTTNATPSTANSASATATVNAAQQGSPAPARRVGGGRRRRPVRTLASTRRRRTNASSHASASGTTSDDTPSSTSRSTLSRRMNVMRMSTAFRGACVSWRLEFPTAGTGGGAGALRTPHHGAIVQDLLETAACKMRNYLSRYQRDRQLIKYNCSLHVEFVQSKDESIVTVPPIVLVTDQQTVSADTDIGLQLNGCAQQLGDRIVSYEGNGSGWVTDNLIWMDVTVWEIDPLRGSTYFPLSDWIKNTRCVINPQNTDQECFRHAVMIALYDPGHASNRSRVSSYLRFYQEEDAPHFEGLEYPLRVIDVGKFESLNKDISVNIYGVVDYGNNRYSNDAENDRDDELNNDDDEEEGDDHGESTMSDGECSSDEDDEETEEDRRFLNDNVEQHEDIAFYRHVDNELDTAAAAADTDTSTHQTSYTIQRGNRGRKRTKQGKRGGYIYPIRIAPEIRGRHVNLLCVEDPDHDGKFHYSCIKNFSGLVRGQYNKHGSHNLHFCYR